MHCYNITRTTNYHTPAHSPIVEMAGCGWDGYQSLFALRADGTVWSCGYNGTSGLGIIQKPSNRYNQLMDESKSSGI